MGLAQVRSSKMNTFPLAVMVDDFQNLITSNSTDDEDDDLSDQIFRVNFVLYKARYKSVNSKFLGSRKFFNVFTYVCRVTILSKQI